MSPHPFVDPGHVIVTRRCQLRYPSAADIPHIWSATRVAGFNEGMLWDPPNHIDELQIPYQRSLESWAQGKDFTWTIETRTTLEFVGRISIRQESHAGEWSIGFWVHPKMQACGYASEAAMAIVEFGFDRLLASVITAAHATWNHASGCVLTRVGMRQVRTNPQGFKKHGVWVEEYEYELRANSPCKLKEPPC